MTNIKKLIILNLKRPIILDFNNYKSQKTYPLALQQIKEVIFLF